MPEGENQPTNNEPDYFVSADENASQAASTETVTWSASAFLEYQKDAGWYIKYAAALITVSAVTYLITQDYFAPIAIVVLGVLLAVAAGRKPRIIQYAVDAQGVHIGTRVYAYDDFQSFSVLQEGGLESIMLVPHKRWLPAITMYFSPDDGEKIFDALSQFLPFEDREKDFIDKFLHKIRF